LQSFDAVSILFCELVDFSSSTVQDAMDVVMSMNAVFSCFDALMDRYNVYKVRKLLDMPTASKMWIVIRPELWFSEHIPAGEK